MSNLRSYYSHSMAFNRNLFYVNDTQSLNNNFNKIIGYDNFHV